MPNHIYIYILYIIYYYNLDLSIYQFIYLDKVSLGYLI